MRWHRITRVPYTVLDVHFGANFRDITKLEEKVCKGFDENIKMGNISPKYHILHRAVILI
jgi:hypothetical protein